MKHHLISYFLSNISAKSCHNRIVYVKIIASRRWDVFLRHSVEVVTVMAVILLLSTGYSERIISVKNVVLTYPVQSTSFEGLKRHEIIY